jgi:hypothetical protein
VKAPVEELRSTYSTLEAEKRTVLREKEAHTHTHTHTHIHTHTHTHTQVRREEEGEDYGDDFENEEVYDSEFDSDGHRQSRVGSVDDNGDGEGDGGNGGGGGEGDDDDGSRKGSVEADDNRSAKTNDSVTDGRTDTQSWPQRGETDSEDEEGLG